MTSLYQINPDAEHILNLEPEELASLILITLRSRVNREQDNNFHPGNESGQEQFREYSRDGQIQSKISIVYLEGWNWLVSQGFLALRNGDGWHFITRKGLSLKYPDGFDTYKKGILLPKKSLHPSIAEKVWSTFVRGDYDTAVFQSFKEVEIAVRTKAKLPPTDIGTHLMRKAFDEKNGPLTDKTKPESERQALSNLFAGAMGYYKNPGSHRTVPIQDPAEAVEMIMLASHLLRIVDVA